MAIINWGRLRQQDRVKEVGVPWSPEESRAVHILKVPADSVRKGCLTMEDHEKLVAKETEQVEKTGKVPLKSLKKADLLDLCVEHEIMVTEEATNATLVELLLEVGVPKMVPVK